MDVNSLSVANRSPLFWPSVYGYGKVVAILLGARANPSFVDEAGATALSVAWERGHDDITKALENSQLDF